MCKVNFANICHDICFDNKLVRVEPDCVKFFDFDSKEREIVQAAVSHFGDFVLFGINIENLFIASKSDGTIYKLNSEAALWAKYLFLQVKCSLWMVFHQRIPMPFC